MPVVKRRQGGGSKTVLLHVQPVGDKLETVENGFPRRMKCRASIAGQPKCSLAENPASFTRSSTILFLPGLHLGIGLWHSAGVLKRVTSFVTADRDLGVKSAITLPKATDALLFLVKNPVPRLGFPARELGTAYDVAWRVTAQAKT
jgi:hypothetical protein